MKEPSRNQLSYLRHLGYDGPEPQTMQEADTLIKQIKRGETPTPQPAPTVTTPAQPWEDSGQLPPWERPWLKSLGVTKESYGCLKHHYRYNPHDFMLRCPQCEKEQNGS